MAILAKKKKMTGKIQRGWGVVETPLPHPERGLVEDFWNFSEHFQRFSKPFWMLPKALQKFSYSSQKNRAFMVQYVKLGNLEILHTGGPITRVYPGF